MQKNGGNVVSYFLTPQGRVINAVVGPANADELLAEAKWAVDTYRKACEVGGDDAFAQIEVVAQAHASREDDRTHRLLAENPLVPLPRIQQQVFEKLAGQKASQDRSDIELAARGFAQAKQKGRPVLLVLANERREPNEWDSATAQLLVRLNTRPIAPPLRSCVVVVLPIDELPALTNLVNLPDLDLAERRTPTMVMTGSDGAQVAAISCSGAPREVARRIWDALNQFRLNKAEKLIESGKLREATALFKLVKASPHAGPLKDQAVARLAELQSLLESHSSKSPAPGAVNAGPKQPAIANHGGLPGHRVASSRSPDGP